MTTEKGTRLATSVGGILTGRGADWLIVDDPLKPDEAISDTVRKSVNDWYDGTLYSRLNNKKEGCIIIIMQRLHEDDLVGHVLQSEGWRVIRLPAIAEQDEVHNFATAFGQRTVLRRSGEVLHSEREPLEILEDLRRTQGEYNFAGQYQQAPSPYGGGMVKAEWFRRYSAVEEPLDFELVVQSWDTANKASELSDYSVCTTWGIKQKKCYLLNVMRRRLEYPQLKRSVIEQAQLYSPKVILIEDKSSGTPLIQELNSVLPGVARYSPKMEKVMRMHAVTGCIENGLVYLPEKAPWLADYLHELVTFPKGKYDDQADSTSQFLDWQNRRNLEPSIMVFTRREVRRMLVAEGRLTEVEAHDLKYPQDRNT
jgi:predicted phage terminase large subunit-like protein